VLLTILLGGALPAAAASRTPVTDIESILVKMADEDLVERTYGALAVQHFAKKQWGFTLFSHAEQRPWQRVLAPAARQLVEMLAEDGALEWIDQNGVTEKTTTPRQEAARALLALERASVEPLIAALDRPPLARKADELLRQIVRGGPTGHDRAAWQGWWSGHQGQALPNEHGQGWLLLLGALALGGVGTFVFRRQRAPKKTIAA
jgi:LPXTG-motif cell wall-anchored protein